MAERQESLYEIREELDKLQARVVKQADKMLTGSQASLIGGFVIDIKDT